MPPPPRKKRKGSASVPDGSGLSLELISHVASFANFGSDALNICLAVGPNDANVIRHSCLRNNMQYLEHRLDQYALDEEITSDQVTVYVEEWMAVNTDWRKHCTEENRKECAIVQLKKSETEESDRDGDEENTDEGDDDIIFNVDAPVLFNNPLVAIEFGLVDPLKHLVEEVGIDINRHEWNTYTRMDKLHLLTLASWQKNSSCFRYLLSREELNVNGKVATFADGSLAHNIIYYAFEDELVSLASFEAIASHSSFDANCPREMEDSELIFPLQYALNSISKNRNETDDDLDKKEEKIMSLLNKFKAHPFSRTSDFRAPAIAVADQNREEDPRMDRIYWAMMEVLSIDEQHVWMMTPIDEF